jgi:hypothetical protein
MKNQYFGDINDYLKYGMLRAFGRELSIAVIWMMTLDDGSNDGRKLGYLDGPGRRSHDPELFDWLRAWRDAKGARDVRLIEDSGLLPNCRFFRDIVPDEIGPRAEWFARAREFARGADLVFLDPDNGLPVRSVRPGRARWSKFVGFEELKALHDDGHSLLIYQHLARVQRRDFIRAKLRELYDLFEVEHFTSFLSFDWVGFVVSRNDHLLEVGRAERAITLRWDTAIRVNTNVVIPVPASQQEIRARPNRAIVKELSLKTTDPGYVNRNGQEVVRKTGTAGTDHGQSVYVLRCTKCDLEYGVNGSGIFQAKCPACQRGAPGLRFAR